MSTLPRHATRGSGQPATPQTAPKTAADTVPVAAGRPMPMIFQADARTLPLADHSVDLVITSPPYYGQRSYTDGGRHYDGQIGAEPTLADHLDTLLDVTRECMRVLKPNGSIWVNLGDKYATSASGSIGASGSKTGRRDSSRAGRPKSLLGIPWRYAIRCIDEL